LNVYFDICEELGFSAIKITGRDKGKKMQEKLSFFRYSSNIKVLLTTLQKSSEGFNFDMATHVIILELWWNPQKLFQAMSRIDRKTQKRNIFIYLLCYNENGIIIEQEEKYYAVLTHKVADIQSTYKRIDDKYADNGLLSKNKEMPEIKIFNDINTFDMEFPLYISQFQHTPKSLIQFFDNFGASLGKVREKMEIQTRDYLRCIEVLSIAPWRIIYSEIAGFIERHNYRKINSSIGRNLIDKINNKSTFYPYKIIFESYYPFVFFKGVKFTVRVNSKVAQILIYYVLGKQTCGKIDILSMFLIIFLTLICYSRNCMKPEYQEYRRSFLQRICQQ
jgi:hypothetical protein